MIDAAAGRQDFFEMFLFGGIGALQQRAFGSLTLELTGSDAGVDAVIAELRAITEVKEENR